MAELPPRRRPLLRWALIALAVLLLLPAAALAVFLATFDAAALKPRIEAAVEGATGRDLTLAGPVGVKVSLVPTVTLQDVALANIPGGSRPEMLRVRRVEVELALLPLLSRRLELRRVLLDGPDLLLETDAEGRPNWVFAAPPGEAPPAAAAAPPPSGTTAPEAARGGGLGGLAVDRVSVADGLVTWRGAPEAPPRTLAVRRLDARARDGEGGALALSGDLAFADLPFALAGEVGPPGALLDPAAPPWPLRLALEAEGARLSAEGVVERGQGARRGYRLVLAARVPELARFAPMVPDLPLPPLRGIEAAATLADAGGGAAGPAVSDLTVTVGESDLNLLRPGLVLTGLTVRLPDPGQPVLFSAEGRIGSTPLASSGTLGPPSLLAAAAEGAARPPYPVDLAFRAADAGATVRGQVADPRALTGLDLAVALRVPQLAALAPLLPDAAAALPPVRDLAAGARVAERGPAFAGGAFLRDLAVTSSAGDLAGELTWVVGARQGVTGRLASRRLDLDALLPPSSAPAPDPAAQAPPQAAPAARGGRVIPALPLPLEALRITDTDLRLSVAELRHRGTAWQQVEAHAVVQDGRGRLDPAAATLAGAGRVALRAAADVTQDPPAVQVALRSEGPGIDLATAFASLGLPQRAAGRLEVDADLSGRGRDLRAVAGSASGHLGLAMPGGRLDGSLLEAVPAELRRILLPSGAGGDIALRCLALRLDAQDGRARVRTLLLDSALGRLGGEGGINLEDETLALRLLPDLRVGPVQVRAPVHVAGTLADPRIGVSPEAAAASGLGAFLSLQRTPDRGLQALTEALGGAGGGGPALPDCATALAAARGGRQGAAAPPAEEAPRAGPAAPATPDGAAPAIPGLPRELQAPAQELLRGLFGRPR